MNFEDFGACFTYVSMCHFQFQDSDGANVNQGNWFTARIDESWNLATAGGCQSSHFAVNSQILVTIPVSFIT